MNHKGVLMWVVVVDLTLPVALMMWVHIIISV